MLLLNVFVFVVFCCVNCFNSSYFSAIVVLQASARHHCSYLVHSQMTEFLRVGGDSRWLQGLQFAPKKLTNLYEVNKILAHRPWLLDRQHVEVGSCSNHFNSH